MRKIALLLVASVLGLGLIAVGSAEAFGGGGHGIGSFGGGHGGFGSGHFGGGRYGGGRFANGRFAGDRFAGHGFRGKDGYGIYGYRDCDGFRPGYAAGGSGLSLLGAGMFGYPYGYDDDDYGYSGVPLRPACWFSTAPCPVLYWGVVYRKVKAEVLAQRL